MGKKSSPPAGPSYQELLSLQSQELAANKEMFDKYISVMEEASGRQAEVTDKILEIQLPAMAEEAEMASELRDRYLNQALPFQDKYVDELSSWDSTERRDAEAGRAVSQVSQAQAAQREQEMRRLESYGIDPSQTRSAALDSRIGLMQAAQRAQVGNETRRQVEREGLTLKGEAMNILAGMPSTAGASLANTTIAGNAASKGINDQYGYLAQGYTTGINNTLNRAQSNQGAYNVANNIWGNQLRAQDMENQQGMNTMNTLGSLAGAAIGAAPFLPGLAEGGSPDGRTAQGIPTQQGQQAQQKPMAMPRPRGQGLPTDSVPARLSPGEFVIPDDVARWEGEKNLQKIINKAREDRMKTEQERAANQRQLGIPA